jgi:hypothetical protein
MGRPLGTEDKEPVPYYQFHVSIHARPAEVERGEPTAIRGRRVTPLQISPESWHLPMARSFEEAFEQLERLPRMFIEPDGAFVWVSSSSDRRWQVDGVLYDRAGRLQFVDVKGECPDEAWRQLLAALGADETPLMFQLVREAVFLDEAGFAEICRVSWLRLG